MARTGNVSTKNERKAGAPAGRARPAPSSSMSFETLIDGESFSVRGRSRTRPEPAAQTSEWEITEEPRTPVIELKFVEDMYNRAPPAAPAPEVDMQPLYAAWEGLELEVRDEHGRLVLRTTDASFFMDNCDVRRRLRAVGSLGALQKPGAPETKGESPEIFEMDL